MVSEQTREVSRYISPDSLLTFLVIRRPDDVGLGFDGFSWHTHGRILAALSGLSEEEAVQRYVDALLDNRSVIAVVRTGGRVADMWIDDDPLDTLRNKYRPENETVSFRLRDGTSANPDDVER